MKNKKFYLLFFAVFLTACSANSSKNPNELDSDKTSNNKQETTQNSTTTSKSEPVSNNKEEDEQNSTITSKSATDSNNKSSQTSIKNNGDITEKVKNYIFNGQGNKPDASKLKWSKAFLDQVDIDSLYKKYIANGGNADDLQSFATYLTLNAPISSNWKDLFYKDLYATNGENVSRLEYLSGDLYQAYVVINDSEVRYVVVSSRTGYYHG
jgi:hypothetical protein